MILRARRRRAQTVKSSRKGGTGFSTNVSDITASLRANWPSFFGSAKLPAEDILIVTRSIQLCRTGRDRMLESELFALLEGTSDAAFTITPDGQIKSWNKAAERLFGYSPNEVLHKTCYQVLQGVGPLGTQVCHEGCSVMECVGKQDEIPN